MYDNAWNGPVFDASVVPPDQGGGTKHTPGKFPARIKGTEIKPTKDETGNFLAIEFETNLGGGQTGEITARINLWNQSADAKRIANQQLAAICYCVGVSKIDMSTTPPANGLIGGQLMLEIRDQKGNEKYSEIAKFLDMNGNEPGKTAAPNNNGGGNGNAGGPFGAKAEAQPGPFSQQPVQQQQQPQTQQQPQASGGAKAPWAT